MARPSNSAQRRGEITRALVKVMATRGYDGASVADIARAARLTPGLVHYHFENKQEVLLAALRDLAQRHEQHLERRLAGADGDPRAELVAFVDFHLGLGADADPEALACWILLSGEALRQPKVQAEYERTLAAAAARLETIVERGLERKLFRRGASKTVASALIATIQGYFVLAATARSLIPSGSAAAAVKSMADGLLDPASPLAPEVSR